MILKHVAVALAVCASCAATAQKPDINSWPPETYTVTVGEPSLLKIKLPKVKRKDIAVGATWGVFNTTRKKGKFSYTASRKGTEELFIYRANSPNSERLKHIGVTALPKDHLTASVPGTQPGNGCFTIKQTDLLAVNALHLSSSNDSTRAAHPTAMSIAAIYKGKLVIKKVHNKTFTNEVKLLIRAQKPGAYVYLFDISYRTRSHPTSTPCPPILLQLQ